MKLDTIQTEIVRLQALRIQVARKRLPEDRINFENQDEILTPGLKEQLQLADPMTVTAATPVVGSFSSSTKEIAEIDGKFRDAILQNSNVSGDCFPALVGQMTAVLGSMHHPLSKQCPFLYSWGEAYARVEQPTDSLLKSIIASIDELVLRTRQVVLNYYTFLNVKQLEEVTKKVVYEAVWNIIYDPFFDLLKKSVSCSSSSTQLASSM
eukprot:TRINITY_DN6402_c0_g1_i11.p1 TRINITY_DN6402_c0_g1~~TRINITY_DN6402_c0_g1_i11.p1  ORF type:complete len:209 (+),score=39.72 TRINITY_DN6402_c0_g1_i11:605-1231(+)